MARTDFEEESLWQAGIFADEVQPPSLEQQLDEAIEEDEMLRFWGMLRLKAGIEPVLRKKVTSG